MKHYIFLSLMAILLPALAMAQYNKENLKLVNPASASQYHFQNLQLYPVYANRTFVAAHKGLGSYLTLEKALAQKKVNVSEQIKVDTTRGAADVYADLSSVNDLYVENLSKDTVMILAGDVVKGGKQDRMIAQDMLLAPGKNKISLPVYCVEHGRWSTRKGNDYNFGEAKSVACMSVRKAAVKKKDQYEVWNKVAEVVKENRQQSPSGTYNALEKSNDLQSKLQEYRDYFLKQFNSDSNIIGVVAVTGDSILGSDLFASNALFKSESGSLLSSYATEAITFGKTPAVAYEKVNSYLDKFITDENKQPDIVKGQGTILKKGTKTLHLSTF